MHNMQVTFSEIGTLLLQQNQYVTTHFHLSSTHEIFLVKFICAFCEGRKILRYLHRRFDWHYIGQIYGGYFAKICGLLRVYELYLSVQFSRTLFSKVVPHFLSANLLILIRDIKTSQTSSKIVLKLKCPT